MKYSYFSLTDGEIYNDMDVFDKSDFRNSEVLSISYVGRTVPIIQVYSGKTENDYKLYYAKIIAVDTSFFDGAILKIVSDIYKNPVTEKFHPVPLGNSDETNQGEDLCVFGFPSQYEGGMDVMLKDMSTLTFGKHSGFDYFINPHFGLIKTDASINSGNSGISTSINICTCHGI